VSGALNTFTDIVLGPPAAGRECGDCNACCDLLGIDTPELQKDPGTQCPHCTSAGCAVYEERFPVCRSYFCVWRRIAALPEEARPDRLGVFMHLAYPRPAPSPLMQAYIGLMPINGWEDVTVEALEPALAVLRSGALPIWRINDENEELLHPSPAIAGTPEADAWVQSQAAYAQGPAPAPPYTEEAK
jgi:hypothetical protein